MHCLITAPVCPNRTLDLGFEKDLTVILNALNTSGPPRQNVLLSATLTEGRLSSGLGVGGGWAVAADIVMGSRKVDDRCSSRHVWGPFSYQLCYSSWEMFPQSGDGRFSSTRHLAHKSPSSCPLRRNTPLLPASVLSFGGWGLMFSSFFVLSWACVGGGAGVTRLVGISLKDPVSIHACEAPEQRGAEASVMMPDGFTVPEKLQQHVVLVPSKLRLVCLAAFILAKCRVGPSGGMGAWGWGVAAF